MRTRVAAVLLALVALVAAAPPAYAHYSSYKGTGCSGWTQEVCFQHTHPGPYQQTYYHYKHSTIWGTYLHGTHCHYSNVSNGGSNWVCVTVS